MDPTSLPSYYNSKYVNWGIKMPDNVPEPDNAESPESCVVANFTEARPEQSPYRAGWADITCINNYPAMCRFASESPARSWSPFSCAPAEPHHLAKQPASCNADSQPCFLPQRLVPSCCTTPPLTATCSTPRP